MKNREVNHTGDVSKVLLYAKPDVEITPDNNYMIDENRINITVDLDKGFDETKHQLDEIILTWD